MDYPRRHPCKCPFSQQQSRSVREDKNLLKLEGQMALISTVHGMQEPCCRTQASIAFLDIPQASRTNPVISDSSAGWLTEVG